MRAVTLEMWLWAIVAAAVVATTYCFVFKSKIARLDYDRRLWSHAWQMSWPKVQSNFWWTVAGAVLALGIAFVTDQGFAELFIYPLLTAVSICLAVLLVHFVRAPAELHDQQTEQIQAESRRAHEAEQRLVPALEVFAHPRTHGTTNIASVLVRNKARSGRLDQCCCRLVKLETLELKGPCKQEAVGYLSWSEGDGKGRTTNIYTEGILDVVFVGSAGCQVAFLPPHKAFMKEQFRYVLTLEFVADNSAPLTKQFAFEVKGRRQPAVPDGDGGYTESPVPSIEFVSIG